MRCSECVPEDALRSAGMRSSSGLWDIFHGDNRGSNPVVLARDDDLLNQKVTFDQVFEDLVKDKFRLTCVRKIDQEKLVLS